MTRSNDQIIAGLRLIIVTDVIKDVKSMRSSLERVTETCRMADVPGSNETLLKGLNIINRIMQSLTIEQERLQGVVNG